MKLAVQTNQRKILYKIPDRMKKRRQSGYYPKEEIRK